MGVEDDKLVICQTLSMVVVHLNLEFSNITVGIYPLFVLGRYMRISQSLA